MKKAVVFGCVAVLILAAGACKGGGKYGDIQKVMEKYIAASEKLATAMDGVKNANDVAAALTAFAKSAEDLAPKIKEFETKYPELKDMNNPPEELKPVVEKAQAVAGKMMEAMGKVAPYASDPKVQEAQARITTIMGQMR